MHANPELLALLALGEPTGSPADRDHIKDCATCSAEVMELARLADIGRSARPDEGLHTPSPEVWERIRAELGLTQVTAEPVPPPLHAITRQPASRDRLTPVSTGGRGGRWVLALAVAAALALSAGIGIGAGVDRWRAPDRTVIARAELAGLPSWPGAAGEAVIEQDDSGNRVLVITMATARPVEGNRQVWLIDTQVEGMTSIGFVTASPTRLPIPADLDLAEFPIVDVSKEPANDRDPAHSTDSIIRGTLTR